MTEIFSINSSNDNEVVSTIKKFDDGFITYPNPHILKLMIICLSEFKGN